MVVEDLHEEAQNTVKRQRRHTPVWVPATGGYKTRLKKARHYLKHSAWIPSDPRERKAAMFVVVCNLRRYHCLWAETALALIRDHYDPRCIAEDGSSWTLTDAELIDLYRQAGRRGKFPSLGVADPKAKVLASRKELFRQLQRFWKRRIRSGGTCTPSDLREAFIRFRGGEDLTLDRFTKAVSVVFGAKTVRPFGSSRFYRGFHLEEPSRRSAKTTQAGAAA